MHTWVKDSTGQTGGLALVTVDSWMLRSLKPNFCDQCLAPWGGIYKQRWMSQDYSAFLGKGSSVRIHDADVWMGAESRGTRGRLIGSLQSQLRAQFVTVPSSQQW